MDELSGYAMCVGTARDCPALWNISEALLEGDDDVSSRCPIVANFQVPRSNSFDILPLPPFPSNEFVTGTYDYNVYHVRVKKGDGPTWTAEQLGSYCRHSEIVEGMCIIGQTGADDVDVDSRNVMFASACCGGLVCLWKLEKDADYHPPLATSSKIHTSVARRVEAAKVSSPGYGSDWGAAWAVSCGDDNRMIVWDVEKGLKCHWRTTLTHERGSGENAYSLQIPSGPTSTGIFGDSVIAFVTLHDELQMYDISASGKRIWSVQLKNRATTMLAMPQSKELFVVCDDGKVEKFDLRMMKPGPSQVYNIFSPSYCWAMRAAGEHHAILGTNSQQAVVLDLTTGKVKARHDSDGNIYGVTYLGTEQRVLREGVSEDLAPAASSLEQKMELLSGVADEGLSEKTCVITTASVEPVVSMWPSVFWSAFCVQTPFRLAVECEGLKMSYGLPEGFVVDDEFSEEAFLGLLLGESPASLPEEVLYPSWKVFFALDLKKRAYVVCQSVLKKRKSGGMARMIAQVMKDVSGPPSEWNSFCVAVVKRACGSIGRVEAELKASSDSFPSDPIEFLRKSEAAKHILIENHDDYGASLGYVPKSGDLGLSMSSIAKEGTTVLFQTDKKPGPIPRPTGNVTIHCQDVPSFKLPCHIEILTLRSEFFGRLIHFRGPEWDTLLSTKTISVMGLDDDSLQKYLQWIYCGVLDDSIELLSCLMLWVHACMYQETVLCRELRRKVEVLRKLSKSRKKKKMEKAARQFLADHAEECGDLMKIWNPEKR